MPSSDTHAPGHRRERPQRIPWRLLARALRILFSYRRTLAVAISSTAGAAVIWFARPYLLRELTDTAIAGEYGLFVVLVGASFGVALVEMISTYFRGSSVSALGALAVRDVRTKLTAKILRLPLPTIESYHSGDLVSRFSNDLDQTSALYRRAPDYIHQPLQLVGGLLFMLWISPKLTLVVCAAMPISVYIFDRVVRPMQQHSGNKMEALAKANASFQDAIRGSAIVRAFGLQNLLGDRFRRHAEDVERHDRKNQIRNMLSFIPFLTLRYIPQLLVPIYGGLLAFRGEISVGDLLAVNWLIWPVFLPLEAFLAWIREVRQAAPALQRTFEILDAPPERVSGAALDPKNGADPIAFDHVTFGYNGNGSVLSGMSFRVRRGATVALVGSSGCGKTTILKVLCGFVEPSEGAVRLYGEPLHSLSLASARDHISLMAQDPFLFPVTIAENITQGRSSASIEEIEHAARAAHAHDFITELPDGYESPVGELGSRLSVGQRQRICLARMILKDAPIVLLDEPTAALDTQSESVVLEALGRLAEGKTTVLVSHRLSTLKRADEILIVDGGAIRASGTHDELYATDPFYREFADHQLRDGSPGSKGAHS